MTLWIKSKIEMLSIISPLYKKDYATVRTTYNTSKRLQALKYWLHKFDSFLDRTVGSMESMQQFMRAIFILAVDSHSTIEYAIQFLFMNMAINHFNT